MCVKNNTSTSHVHNVLHIHPPPPPHVAALSHTDTYTDTRTHSCQYVQYT